MKQRFVILIILFVSHLSKGQEYVALSGTQPIILTSTGTGLYNKSVLGHDASGYSLQLAKTSDAWGGTSIDFKIDTRGQAHEFFALKGATGNVGIGTHSPTAKLDVRGIVKAINTSPTDTYTFLGQNATSDASTYSYFYHRITSNYHMIGSNGAPGAIRKLGFAVGGGDIESDIKMTIDQDGDVGIGATTPAARLSFRDMNTAGLETPEGITWYNVSPMSYGIFRTPGAWSSPNYQQLKIAFGTGIILDPGTANTKSFVEVQGNGLRVTSGNVGIGTIAPSSKVDITNNVDGAAWNLEVANEHHDAAGDQAVGIKLKLGDPSESNKWAGILGVGEGAWENNVGLSFYTTGYVSGSQNTEKMRITSNGNVGIGTSNPGGFKLAVEGKIGAREVNVTATDPWPDYVFEKDYNLLSLDSIKTYIDQHKHLPEMPSAKEMEANGVNLGEMNIMLLKKVEELTLYLIDQNKKYNAQAEIIQAQNKRLSDLESQLNNK